MANQVAFTAKKLNSEVEKMEEKDIFEDSAIELLQGNFNESLDESEVDQVEN